MDNLVKGIVGLLCGLVVIGALFPRSITSFSNTGIIVNNSDGYTLFETSLDWGTLTAGQIVSKQVPYTEAREMNYTMLVSNWVPEVAANFLNITFETLAESFNFTLTVSPQIQGVEKFSFDITMNGVKA